MGESVGKISLGVEIEDFGNLTSAINMLGKSIANKLSNSVKKNLSGMNFGKDLTDNLTESAKNISNIFDKMFSNLSKSANEMFNKINSQSFTFSIPKNDSFKNLGAKTESKRGPPMGEEEYAAASETLVAKIENVNAKIETQKNLLKQLKVEYEKLTTVEFYDKFGNLRSGIDETSSKAISLKDKILGVESKIISLTETSDKLNFKLVSLDSAMESTGDAAEEMGNKVEKSNFKFSFFGNMLKGFGKKLFSLIPAMSLLGKVSKKAGETGNRAFNLFSGSLLQVAKRILILRVIAKLLRGFIGYLGMAMNSSSSFSNSLATIKLNLAAAFQPILNVIIPILNAFMSTLATVTGYIAAFVATLFGTTYKASVKGAKGIKQQSNALKGLGGNAKGAAKELGSLAAFDEINTINLSDSSGGGSGGGGAGGADDWSTAAETEIGDTSVFDGVIDVLSKIFEPFKNAWESEGLNTVNAFKFAMSEIKGLVVEVGKSLYEVWTNGTGETYLINNLQILQAILTIIGKIASSFKKAWADGGKGTSFIQKLANGFINLQELIKRVLSAITTAWDKAGDSFTTRFMSVVDTLAGLWKTLTEALLVIWDNGGGQLFESILAFILKAGEFIGFLFENYLAPLLTWLTENLAPVFGELLGIMAPIFDAATEFLDWLMNDGKPVLDAIVIIVTSITGAFVACKVALLALTAAKTAYTLATNIGTIAAGVFGKAILALSAPFVAIPLAIGAVIAIGVLLIKHWDTVKEIAGNVWNWIKNLFNSFKTWLSGVFARDWSKTFGILGEGLNLYLGTVKTIWNTIKGVFEGIINFIVGVFTGDWSRAWSGLVSIFGNIFKGITELAKKPINFIIKLINGFIRGLNKIRIPDWVPGVGGYGIHLSEIPELAKGGFIDQPTLAMVGERGKEAVIPMEHNTGGLDKLASLIAERLGVGNSTVSGGNLYITLELDSEVVSKKVIENYNDAVKQGGKPLMEGGF